MDHEDYCECADTQPHKRYVVFAGDYETDEAVGGGGLDDFFSSHDTLESAVSEATAALDGNSDWAQIYDRVEGVQVQFEYNAPVYEGPRLPPIQLPTFVGPYGRMPGVFSVVKFKEDDE